MKWTLLFLWTFSLLAKEISYQITPAELNGSLALKILCEFEGNSSGMTDLIFPCLEERLYLDEVKIFPENSQIEETDHPDVKRIYHHPIEKLQIEYVVASQEESHLPYQDRPLIQKDYFLFFGYNVFVHLDQGYLEEAHIRLEWKDFPRGWDLANSYGINASLQEMDQPMWLFLNGVFGGGKGTITQRLDAEAPLFVATYGQFSFSQERLVDTIEKIIVTEREFWSDYDFPYTFVAVHPCESNSFAGQGTPNGFSLFIKDFPDVSKEDWKNLAFLVSHEYFHTWNSIKMQPVPLDQSMAWFVEGFTDYYAAKLLWRSALIDEKGYLGFIQEAFDEYSVSPVKNETNEKIKEDFWKTHAIQKLPYYRGCLLAFHWDCLLKQNGKNLDQVMQRLFHRAQQQNQQYSIEDLIELAELPSAREDIERYILAGETFNLQEFHDLLFSPGALPEFSP